MTEFTGSCLCGQVRYTARGEPQVVGICHCRHCQRQSGAPFSVVWGYAEEAISQTGTLQTYADRGDTGAAVRRQFCPICGSPVFSGVATMPGLTFIKAGTLDDPGSRAPMLETYCDRAWPWLPPLAGDRHRLALLAQPPQT